MSRSSRSTHVVGVEVDTTGVHVLSSAMGYKPGQVRFEASSDESLEDAEAKMDAFLRRVVAALETGEGRRA